MLLFQDITGESRRAEFSRHLGRIMGRALNEIYFLDPVTLHFTLTNDGAQKKLGYTAQQLELMAFPDVLSGISTEDVSAMLAPLLNGSKAEIVFETVIRTANGRDYPAEICMQYFADEHPPILVAIVHETSDRQQLQPG